MEAVKEVGVHVYEENCYTKITFRHHDAIEITL
jgi:hypothetical protein